MGLTASASPVSEDNKIENNAKPFCYDKYEFFVTQTPGEYDLAKFQCEKVGGNLLSWKTFGSGPDGDEHFSAIESVISSSPSNYLWIGVNDKASEGNFYWEDGTRFTDS